MSCPDILFNKNFLIFAKLNPITMRNATVPIFLIAGFLFLLGCSNNTLSSGKSFINEDSLKSIILAKEMATLDRWYNGDPMGFIDNSWGDVTYFDPSLYNRCDSIEAFRNILNPIKGLVHVPAHKMDKPMVQLFGDIALLTFTDVFTIGENTSRWHATEIYQHRGNDWKLIHSHWTESKVK
jgi:hypothetical protein